jgi:hypothetical protein
MRLTLEGQRFAWVLSSRILPIIDEEPEEEGADVTSSISLRHDEGDEE